MTFVLIKCFILLIFELKKLKIRVIAKVKENNSLVSNVLLKILSLHSFLKSRGREEEKGGPRSQRGTLVTSRAST